MILNICVSIAASQNEVKSQSSYLNADEILSPKQKNQSTSPNLPLNETIISEEEVSMRHSRQVFAYHVFDFGIFRNLSRQPQAYKRSSRKSRMTTMPKKMKSSRRPQQQRRPSKRSATSRIRTSVPAVTRRRPSQ